jgi:hypothetical protein
LKLVVSFYVAYIEKAPNEAFKSGTLDFLTSAGCVTGKEEIARTPGLMGTIGVVLDPRSNNNIESATEDMAKRLVKYLF